MNLRTKVRRGKLRQNHHMPQKPHSSGRAQGQCLASTWPSAFLLNCLLFPRLCNGTWGNRFHTMLFQCLWPSFLLKHYRKPFRYKIIESAQYEFKWSSRPKYYAWVPSVPSFRDKSNPVLRCFGCSFSSPLQQDAHATSKQSNRPESRRGVHSY